MGFFDKIKQSLSKTRQSVTVSLNSVFAEFTGENEEFFEELEELLIMADAGAQAAQRAVSELRAVTRARGLRGGDEVKNALKEILTGLLEGSGEAQAPPPGGVRVVLVAGVNGVGKTTTIGKLAYKLKNEGKKVLLCAGDTFRAAAAEQLAVWAQRADAALVRHDEGSDPAAVVFDALCAAKARSVDAVICDTAGRLHNKQNLMNELGKIRRVIEREMPDAYCEALLVLDATTGQNGLIQARQFNESAKLTGIVLTKLDGTAKGGIVFAIAGELGLPVKYVGVGEKIDDLVEFDPGQFVEALLS